MKKFTALGSSDQKVPLPIFGVRGCIQAVCSRTLPSPMNSSKVADAIGVLGDRTITQRLGTIERVLFALGVSPGHAPDEPA